MGSLRINNNPSYSELKQSIKDLTKVANTLNELKVTIIDSEKRPSFNISDSSATLNLPESVLTDCTECEDALAAAEAEVVSLEAEIDDLTERLTELCENRPYGFFGFTTSREIADGSTGSSRNRDVYAPRITLQLNSYPIDASSDLTWTTTSDQNYLNSFNDSYPNVQYDFAITPYPIFVKLRGRFNGDTFYQLQTKFSRRVGFTNDRSGLGASSTGGTSSATYVDQQNGDTYTTKYDSDNNGIYDTFGSITMSYSSTSFNDASPATVTDMPTINVKIASDPFGTNQTSVDLSVSEDYEIVVSELGNYEVIGSFSVIGTDQGGDAQVLVTDDPCSGI